MLLEHLEIAECHELEHIIADEEQDHVDNNSDSVTVFPKLRHLEVRNCNLLTMLLPVSLAHGLGQLKSIALKEAPQLEYVFGHDDLSSHQIENDIEFPALTDLELRKLPKMINICSKNYYPTWPILNSLTLSKCPLLKISSIIDCIREKGSRENVIEGCQSRIEVQALENILNLENLKIMDDHELEGVFLHEGLPSSWQQAQLSSKLEDLTLKDLPSLMHICKTPLVLSFQNLEYLHVHGCGKLSCVLSACVLRDLPQLQELSIRDCDQLEQIVEDQEDHEVCFPSLNAIEIQRCNKLNSLFSVNKSNAFPKLQRLMIEEASQLEVVFRHNMCNADDKLTLPSLYSLELVKLPSLVSVCLGFKLQTVIALRVKDCPKLPSTTTATAEAFPHEHQNAEEKGKEAKEEVEEEIKGEEHVPVNGRKAIELNRDIDKRREDKGKRPAKIVLTSNERKDPQTPTNHSEDNQCKEAKAQGKEGKREAEMAMAHATATSIGDNSALAETNTAFNQNKVQVLSEIILTEPYEELKEAKSNHPKIKDVSLALDSGKLLYTVCIEVPAESSDLIAPQNIHIPLEVDSLEEYATPSNIGAVKHLGEKEEKKEVHIEVAQTGIHQNNVKGSSETALAKPFEGRDAALQMTTKGYPIVSDTPPGIPNAPCSEILLSSVSLLRPAAPPPEVDPLTEEYANFRDIGSIKKKHIPLLEEAIVKYPSLWTWRARFKRSHMKRSGYISLGDMLEFLASTKWKDLTEEKIAEFESLVDELEVYEFDVQWLQKTRAMIERRKLDDETINRMKTLEVQVMEQEIEVQKAKAKLEATKLELEAIRAKVGKFDDIIGF